MKNLRTLVTRFEPFKYPCINVEFSHRTSKKSSPWFFPVIISLNPFWIQICYFIVLSLVGYLALKILGPKTALFKPKDIDAFFTAVSAATVSSMLTLNMEVFSNTQLMIITLLMFMGGEVFVYMLGLQFRKFKYGLAQSDTNSTIYPFEGGNEFGIDSNDQENLKYNTIRSLGFVVLCYLLIMHFVGFISTYVYIALTPSAKTILMNKGLSRLTFALFTTVSTFSNCGFIPTNESLMIFKKNTGLLLILIPQILLGNTLYPVALRLLISTLEKTTKRVEYRYILKNAKETGHSGLFPGPHSCYLATTVFGLLFIQTVVFCCVEWDNIELNGLNVYTKLVGSLFQVLNTRHSGETLFDLSKISPAVLVTFIFMMYLPPLTTFLPIEDHENISGDNEKSDKTKSFGEYLRLSELSYLVIFTFIICLTERKQINDDPLNFRVLNIVFEIVSAYGNVGLSTCYSCARQIKNDGDCKDAWFGFVGKWSNNGKLMLILVMLVGRLKKFNKNGGRLWKPS